MESGSAGRSSEIVTFPSIGLAVLDVGVQVLYILKLWSRIGVDLVKRRSDEAGNVVLLDNVKQ